MRSSRHHSQRSVVADLRVPSGSDCFAGSRDPRQVPEAPRLTGNDQMGKRIDRTDEKAQAEPKAGRRDRWNAAASVKAPSWPAEAASRNADEVSNGAASTARPTSRAIPATESTGLRWATRRSHQAAVYKPAASDKTRWSDEGGAAAGGGSSNRSGSPYG